MGLPSAGSSELSTRPGRAVVAGVGLEVRVFDGAVLWSGDEVPVHGGDFDEVAVGDEVFAVQARDVLERAVRAAAV